MSNAFASGFANPNTVTDGEVVVSIYGPRGGTQACFGIAPAAALALAAKLIDGAIALAPDSGHGKARFNHMFTLAFELESEHPTGDDVTPAMLRDAVMRRIGLLDGSDERKGTEWVEAVGMPDNTYENDAEVAAA
jgi:hypothetical protein